MKLFLFILGFLIYFSIGFFVYAILNLFPYFSVFLHPILTACIVLYTVAQAVSFLSALCFILD